jgi:hypothetical protein
LLVKIKECLFSFLFKVYKFHDFYTDCDTYDQGCNGGLPENVFNHYTPTHGLQTEQAYSVNNAPPNLEYIS